MLRSRGAFPDAVLLALVLVGCSPETRGGAAAGVEREAEITTRTPVPHTLGFDRYSLLIDGQRLSLWAGEFHYWRLPSPALWRDVLEKMKAAGYNAATIYFDWG